MTAKQVTFPVRGMTCAACQSFVQKSLEARNGVHGASVNLLMHSATVEFDPEAVSARELVEVVNDTGYEAELPQGRASAIAEQEMGEQQAEREYIELRRKAVVCLVLAAMAMVLSMPLMTHSVADPFLHRLAMWMDSPVRAALPMLYEVPSSVLRLLLLAITLAAIGWGGRSFFEKAWSAARHRAADMNTLIALGVASAFIFSTVVTIAPGFFASRGMAAEVYFEAAVFILALVLVGRTLEARAKRQTSAALRVLASLQPDRVRIQSTEGETEIPLDELQVGDVAVARPGERIAADGEIIEGTGAVDESMLTGEPIPVDKAPGSPITGGSLNLQGLLLYRVLAVGAETVLERILRMLRDAQAEKPPMQRLADRVSAVFVPAVLAVAGGAGVAWYAATGDAVRAWTAAVAVLIIACPCAMGLATPAAFLAATGRAASAGILVRGGDALERLARASVMVFDKTGTLTEGRPRVSAVVPGDGVVADSVVRVAAVVEQGSEHPLAAAVLEQARQLKLEIPSVEDFRALPGLGAQGRVEGRSVVAGRASLLRDRGLQVPSDSSEATTMWVAEDGRVLGRIEFDDKLRPFAREAVESLRAQGLDVVLLSGDREAPVRRAAHEAGIDTVVAGVLPDGKVEELRRLKSSGQVVAMAGDGINDAPALAAADAGLALGTGTDAARQSAGFVLMRPDLRLVPQAVLLSRKAVAVMRQNLFWAFAYNVLMIPIAAGAFYPWTGWLLSPVLASAAMSLSSVTVVLNSLRLRGTDLE